MTAVRVLVIDDDPLIGDLLRYQLSGAGYNVLVECDPLRALGRVSREKPDLLLLDVMMPGMSGWDLCRQVRAALTIPIIMLTGKDAEEDIVRGLQAGADDYVGKPFTLAQLQARIEAVLRRAGGAQSAVATRVAERAAGPVVATPVRSLSAVAAVAAHSVRPATAAVPRLTSGPAAMADQPVPGGSAVSRRMGARLAAARAAQGLTLYQAERGCGVRWDYLQAIEHEQFTAVPRDELRRALRSYSRYLGLSLEELVGRPARAPVAAPARMVPLLPYGIVVVCLVAVLLASALLL